MPMASVNGFRNIANTFLLAIALEGCVSSQFPLLGNDTLVVDDSLIGRYQLATSSSQKPSRFDVFLKGNTYLLVEGSKLAYIGTLHDWHPGTYLAQLRNFSNHGSAAASNTYTYMLVTKTGTGIRLNRIPCATTDPCQVNSVDQLNDLATAAEQHPQAAQVATAIEIAGFTR